MKTDQLLDQWVQGWLAACKKFKAELSESTQKINDVEAQKAVDGVFTAVDHMEKTAFSEAPTVIARISGESSK